MKTTLLALAAAVLIGHAASAQSLAVAEPPADADKVVAIYPGAAPGSELWTWREQLSAAPWGGRGGRLIRNVVQPTLTVFKPPNPARRNGTAIVIAPGGGFRWLSIDSEGYDVARALAAQGVTALVLKYRLNHTADDEAQFAQEARAFLGAITQGASRANAGRPPSAAAAMRSDPHVNPAVADGVAALRYVRDHAAELGVNPDRIGIMGFSAGGIVTIGALRFGQGPTRPAFAGVIYAGAEPNVVWPANVPPVFMAVAADDALVGRMAIDTFISLRTQNHPVELHVFANGGHGFGLQKRGLTTDLWIDEFIGWLAAQGLLK